MTLRICPDSNPCPSDQPLDNFSSEADDTLDYFSTFFYGSTPPLLHNFTATQCGVTFESTISQLDADQMARSAAIQCNNNNNTPVTSLFTNAPQTCCVPCPDGTNTCYTVPGGLFSAATQQEANSIANAVACDLVNRNQICIGNLPGCTCVNNNYDATVTSNVEAIWSLNGGSLPPGLNITFTSTSAEVFGTPNTPGIYTFQILAQSLVGPYMIKTFTITVLQITVGMLPPFTINTPYLFQMSVTGGSGNYNWAITGGSLPDGLTMSPAGAITGTPTGLNLGSMPITFSVVDVACEAAQAVSFPPRISLSSKSTTTIGTILGFDEYEGFQSNPPKRYRTLTYMGTSDQQLWTIPSVTPGYQYVLTDYYGTGDRFVASGGGFQDSNAHQIGTSGAFPFDGQWGIFINDPLRTTYIKEGPINNNPAGIYDKFQGDPAFPANIVVTGPFTQPPISSPSVQFAGAHYDYAGSSQIDFDGTYNSLYTKNLSEFCTEADSLWTVAVDAPNGGLNLAPFVGWIGLAGHNKCTLPGSLTPIRNDAIGKGDLARYDNSFFWGSAQKVGTNLGVSALVANSSTSAACVDSGDGRNSDLPQLGRVIALYDPSPVGTTPQIDNTTQGIIWNFAGVVWNHNFSTSMTDEYTEFDALTAGNTFVGSGATAAYLRSGFTVQQTSVVWTLQLSNLIVGRSYLISYDLLGSNGLTTTSLGITATATSQSVIGNIPVPASGQFVSIRNPQIVIVT